MPNQAQLPPPHKPGASPSLLSQAVPHFGFTAWGAFDAREALALLRAFRRGFRWTFGVRVAWLAVPGPR